MSYNLLSKNNILTISGWGQKPDLISDMLDFSCDSLDYTNKDISTVIEDLRNNEKKYDYIIGWSLGGQIALEIAKNLDIKKLVLISTPYQFVNSDQYNLGIQEKEFKGFCYLLRKDRIKLLEHFRSLIIEDNLNQEKLPLSVENTENLLYWLEFLKNFNGDNCNITQRDIMLIYGKLDPIVQYQQGELYLKKFNKHSSLEVFPLASHIPFMHDTQKFNQLVCKFLFDG